MRLIVASNNAGKLREIEQILGGSFDEILSMRQMGIEIEVDENGDTFEQNALKKAQAIQALLSEEAVISDDSGLAVDALGGAPGVYSARFSGEKANDEDNNKKLLESLKDVPDGKRTARFVSCVCLVRPGRAPLLTLGECSGEIAFSPKGGEGFGYDPLFLSDDYRGRTFGEISADEKNAISHRARAITALCRLLEREEL